MAMTEVTKDPGFSIDRLDSSKFCIEQDIKRRNGLN